MMKGHGKHCLFHQFLLVQNMIFGQQNNLILESQGYFVSFYILSEVYTHIHTHTQDIDYLKMDTVWERETISLVADENLDHSLHSQPSWIFLLTCLGFLAQMVHSSYP